MATTSTDVPGDATGEHERPTRPMPPSDPRSLHRLVEADITPASARRAAAVEARARRSLTGELERPPRHAGRRRRFGYQPGLDGLRALSVAAVFLYHAGFTWMRGGWVGVEVFFVVSGFLITSLLLDEHERSGRVALGEFWRRRARRLLPALAVMLATVATVTLALGSAQQRGELRRDLPWALGYLANWGQIVGGVPYYASDPPLLRHLWTLAIEEQFYVVWPLAFVLLARSAPHPPRHRRDARRCRCGGDGVDVLAAGRRAGPRRRVRWGRSRQLHVPVDVHPCRRAADRVCGGIRLAPVAVPRPT